MLACFVVKRIIFLFTRKPINSMKKIFVLIILAGMIAACSQYTCPTYSKKEAPKKAASAKRI